MKKLFHNDDHYPTFTQKGQVKEKKEKKSPSSVGVTISMVHIDVHDGYPLQAVSFERVQGSNSHIVEDTEPTAYLYKKKKWCYLLVDKD